LPREPDGGLYGAWTNGFGFGRDTRLSNRDKIGDLFRSGAQTSGDPSQPQSGGFLDSISDVLNGGGLSEVLNRFRNAGSGATVDSWVKDGPNRSIQPHEVQAAIEPETLDELARQTGLSRDELLRRLATELPRAVDSLTPDGVVPGEQSAASPNLLDDVPTRASTATGPKIS
jgi:uncharacterized protein YidB (DUF937 family)